MLRLNNIEVKYLNTILVLRGVSLEVGEGSIVALLGANGAGKSTTLKAISGLLHTEEGEVTDGTIEFNERRIERINTESIARLGIIQVSEGRPCFEHLTVEENLRVGANMRRDFAGIKNDLDLVLNYFPKLRILKNKTAGYLSGGERQQMVMGRALLARPKLILLDEPTLGLAPLLVKEIFEIIRMLNIEQKTPLLLVEQNAKAALGIAEYGYVMENGRIVLSGTADELVSNEDIKEFYLGLSASGTKRRYRDIKHYKRRKRWLG
jgi:branched-chain amino acid transport system ATP-binding protein